MIVMTIVFAFSASLAPAGQKMDTIAVGGCVIRPGEHDRIGPNTLAALINRAGGIPVNQEMLKQYQRSEKVSRLRVNVWRGGKKRVYSINPKSNELWLVALEMNDVIEVARSEPSDGEKFPAVLILKMQKENEPTAP